MQSSANLNATPITERPNELTDELDLVSAQEMVRIFRSSDAQIFSGWRHYPSLFDDHILDTMEVVSKQITELFELSQSGADVSVIFSGAGTSGRLAFLCCRNFNLLCKQLGLQPIFHYLIAGSDKALLFAQEQSEDDVIAAVKDLTSVTDNKKKVVLIGITCGLSAPYVAAQFDHALDHCPHIACSLLGFNPAQLARNAPIEKFPWTFKDIVTRLQKAIHSNLPHTIINPVVGPETITGSTRMKSGSCTKIILEAIFMRAIIQTKPPTGFTNLKLVDVLRMYEVVFRDTYLAIEQIHPLITLAAEAITRDARVYYLTHHITFGILGMIDASECPPTFGAHAEDVKGLIFSGWSQLFNKDGDMAAFYNLNFPAIEDFNAGDTVIILHYGQDIPSDLIELVTKAKQKGVKTGLVLIQQKGSQPFPSIPWADAVCGVEVTHTEFGSPDGAFFAEQSLKWVINAISTGAHILKGKIFKNRMIDVRVSNAKLFDRATRLVSLLTGLSDDVCRVYLIQTIYQVSQEDTQFEQIASQPVSVHIERGFVQDKVVPRAVLLAHFRQRHPDKAFQELLALVENTLQKEPVVRKAVTSLLGTSNT